jgi:hypothetical protein
MFGIFVFCKIDKRSIQIVISPDGSGNHFVFLNKILQRTAGKGLVNKAQAICFRKKLIGISWKVREFSWLSVSDKSE